MMHKITNKKINYHDERDRKERISLLPYNSDMLSIVPPLVKSLLVKVAQPKALLVDLPIKLRPNL